MEQNSPNPPSKYWNLPLYLGKAAFVLAFVPLAMVILCVVTKNTITSLIDLYYFFITPLQICKLSVILTLILSFATSISARQIYNVDGKLYWNDHHEATTLASRAAILVIFEMVIYFLSVNRM